MSYSRPNPCDLRYPLSRKSLTNEQRQKLMQAFEKTAYAPASIVVALAERFDKDRDHIATWFENQRCRTRHEEPGQFRSDDAVRMWATTFHKLLRDVYGDFDQLVDTIFFLCDMPCLDDVQTKALASAAGVTLGDVVEVFRWRRVQFLAPYCHLMGKETWDTWFAPRTTGKEKRNEHFVGMFHEYYSYHRLDTGEADVLKLAVLFGVNTTQVEAWRREFVKV